tara:strand:- start:1690 stop:2313 length:624 start_codon:yes stop_codon:yes gene_type:complete
MIKNFNIDSFNTYVKFKKTVTLIAIGLLIFTFSFNQRLNANPNIHCIDEHKVETFIFCYQIKRQKELAESFILIEKSINEQNLIPIQKLTHEKEILVPSTPIEKPIIRPIKEVKVKEIKPKVISRQYEMSLSALDDTGKKNLLYCFENVQLDYVNDALVSHNFYIKAMRKILSTQVRGNSTKIKFLNRPVINQNKCNKLIDLVLGQA